MLRLSDRTSDFLAHIVYPPVVLEMLRRYFRIEIEGAEHIPQSGAGIIAPNHSGCLGLDATMLCYSLHKESTRLARILAVWNLFQPFPIVSSLFQQIGHRVGVAPASFENGLKVLRDNHLLVVFPEGQRGSFKPSHQAYQLQPFRTGFARLALQTKAPVIPCVIIGAEEATINIGSLNLNRFFGEATLPLPLNLLPLPAKWRIRFLPPMEIRAPRAKDINDQQAINLLASNLRKRLQSEVEKELKQRKFVFFSS